MDEELSRKGAELKNSPYWRYLMSIRSDDDAEQYSTAFIDELVKAGTYGNLPDDLKQMFELGDRSYKIAESKKLDLLDPDDLQTLAKELGVYADI